MLVWLIEKENRKYHGRLWINSAAVVGAIVCFIDAQIDYIYMEIPASYHQEDLHELDLMEGTWDLSGAKS